MIVDGVTRYPPSGLNVLVVGAGPGGLFTALECWRKGHSVQILEKTTEPSSIGDLVAIGPSAWSTLHYYPQMLKEYQDLIIDAEMVPCHMNGDQAAPSAEFEHNRDGVAKHAAYPLRVGAIFGRADLAKMFYNQCQRLDINITWGVSIKEYTEDIASGLGVAISETGAQYRADIIVAADGIGSKSHMLTLGAPVRAISTGYTVYRAAMAPTALKDAPLLNEALLSAERRPKVRIYAGSNRHIVFVISPRLVSFALTLPEDGKGTAVESWSSPISPEDLMSRIPDKDTLDPRLIECIKSFPGNTIVAWKLSMRDSQPRWYSEHGHVVQAGDSAHTYIPTSGNGATMALEDAISLAECLRLGGPNGYKAAIKVHQKLRFERTSLVQRHGLVNRARIHKDDSDNIKDAANLVHQGKWLWGHNPEKYATDNFHQAQDHLENGSVFLDTNLPPGYKPEPWNLAMQMEKEKAGIIDDLTSNGDWTQH